MTLDLLSTISETMWMWVVGGTCGIVVLLVVSIGGFMIKSIGGIRREVVEVNKVITSFRIEWAEQKGETVTWEKFSVSKREMEKDRSTEIKLAVSEHLQDYSHSIG